MEFIIRQSLANELYLEVSSDLIDDSIRLMIHEDDYCESSTILTREESIMMAERIIEFWKENPRYKF